LERKSFCECKIIICSNEAPGKTFHDIFTTLDEANSENIRKQYNMCLAFVSRFYWENQITCYTDPGVERYHKFNIKKQLFEKAKYHFKRTDNSFGRRLCNTLSRNGVVFVVTDTGWSKNAEAIKLVYADNDIVYVVFTRCVKFLNNE
jgi:transcription-repair coupling factor (superfamily II helicase)